MINIKRFIVGLLVAFLGHGGTLAQQGSVGAEVTPIISSNGALGFSFRGAFQYTVSVLGPNLNLDLQAYLTYFEPGSFFDGDLRVSLGYGIPLVQGDWAVTTTIRVGTALAAFATPDQSFNPTSDIQWFLFSLVDVSANGSVSPGIPVYAELIGGIGVSLLAQQGIPQESVRADFLFTTGLSTLLLPELEFKPTLSAGISVGFAQNSFTFTFVSLETALNYALAPNLGLSAKPAVETDWWFSGFTFQVSFGVQYKF
jgi:hypothetical protein